MSSEEIDAAAGGPLGNVEEAAALPDTLLLSLERDFNEAMDALEGQESLGHYRLEYMKIYRALKKSHEWEKGLVQKCQEMTQELLSNAAKMQAAVKLAQSDHSTIEALKKNLEVAWKSIDAATDKDLSAKETIKTLNHEIAALKTTIEEGSAFSTDHTNTLEELKLENKRLQVEVEEMSKQSDVYARDITEMVGTQKKAETDIQQNTEDAHRVSDRFELVKQEYNRERNARERAEFQCRELLLVLRTRENELKTRQAQQLSLEGSVSALHIQIHEDQDKKQTLLQKIDTAEKQLYHTQQSYNDSVDTTADLNERLHEMDRQITSNEKKISETRAESERILRVKDADFKELGRLQQQNDNIRHEQEALLRQKSMIEKRIESLGKEQTSLKEALDLLNHETNILEKRGEQQLKKRAAAEALLVVEAENQQELEDSIAREREIGLHLRTTMRNLEKDREKCVGEVSQITNQHIGAREELKMALLTVEETQKKIEESEARLTKQQARYEQVRAERNQFSKKLVEAQDEIVELKQKFKMMDHQLVQFEEELQMKEKKQQEERSSEKASKERLTKARKLVNDYAADFDAAKAKSEAISQQIKQLVKIINVCDKELSEQQQQFLKISNERDLLGTQLIRRNDELALLYEKLRVQQEALSNGESAYRARLDDLRLLRMKLAEVARQESLADNRSKQISEVKTRLSALELMQAREEARVAALSEELENHHNHNRWRKREGTDPSLEELEKKMKELQKRLITKSEESLDFEMVLQEKERLVTELQTILARQAGPEVAIQLNAYHKDLQRKNARMKQMASELNMTSTHISELKYEAERLRRELHETKRRYYDMKMKNDVMMDAGVNPPALPTSA